MQDYKKLELSDLFDILAQQTSHYMKMLSGGATKDLFNSCRETIIEIQMEIMARRFQKSKTSASTPDNAISSQPTVSKVTKDS